MQNFPTVFLMSGYLKKISSKKYEKSPYCGCVAFPEFPYDKNCFLKSDFREISYLPFENMKIPVPVGYEDVLKRNFGDYMKFPPVEERGLHHAFTFEPDIPYLEYMNRKNPQ